MAMAINSACVLDQLSSLMGFCSPDFGNHESSRVSHSDSRCAFVNHKLLVGLY